MIFRQQPHDTRIITEVIGGKGGPGNPPATVGLKRIRGFELNKSGEEGLFAICQMLWEKVEFYY